MTQKSQSAEAPRRPIEPGMTILRASAGTGKTYQLAHIVLRLVVERGLAMREIAVVTFTKAATKELVYRVRRRLVDAESALTAVIRGDAPSGDEVLQAWSTALEDPGACRRSLQRALREFDEALISTIHSFCQSLLVQHAFETGATFGLTLEGSGDELCEEIVDDYLTGTVLASEDDTIREVLGTPARQSLLDIATSVVGEFSMECIPTVLDGSDEVGEARARFAAVVRSEYARRIAERGIVSFADLSRQLNETFTRVSGDDPMLKMMSDRFRAVLVDEFQDTDDQQWNIFQTLFMPKEGRDPHHYLFLVGDAKQAIYGFRGANIRVYGEACQQFDYEWPLTFNYRSDPPLLDGLNTLFGVGALSPDYFSDPAIQYVAVQAPSSGKAWKPQLIMGSCASSEMKAPIQIRYFDALSAGLSTNETPLGKGASEELIAAYTAADITQLLNAGTMLKGRPLEASDIAVLVRSHKQGSQVQAELVKRGIPAAVTAKRSVFMSPLAESIRQWLGALSEPSSQSAARRCAASPLFGWTAQELLGIESDVSVQARWDGWRNQIKTWRQHLDAYGFFRTFRAAMSSAGITARVLRSRDGDRDMTDLLHMVDLIGEVEAEDGLRLPGLIRWMNAPEREDGDNEANKIRLERDDASVRIMTVHKSKGLQFAVVFAPFLGVGFEPKSKPREPFRAPKSDECTARIFDLRSLDVGAGAEADGGVLENWRRKQLEEHRESLRLTYVALTRAKHRLVIYSGHTSFLMVSGLGPLLHAGTVDDQETTLSRISLSQARNPGDKHGLPSSSELAEDLVQVASASGGRIAVTRCERSVLDAEADLGPSADPVALKARRPRRFRFEPEWSRVSYSSLTRDLHGGTHISAAEEEDVTDRGEAESSITSHLNRPIPECLIPWVGPKITLANFPGGTEPGSCLHAIFEHIDFLEPESPKSQSDIRDVVTQQLRQYGLSVEALADEVTRGVTNALLTPIDACTELRGVRLADVARSRRLDELDFLLPIAGGVDYRSDDRASSLARRSDLIEVFRRSIGDGPITGAYVDSLSELRYESFAGFLKGSIDLVFSVDGASGEPRFFVVDYKSNGLNLKRDENPVVQRFNHAWMSDEMAYHHYILQYHLYSVALQRFLRHRIPNYSFEEHFGGALYLFVRGMLGPSTPVSPDHERFGVFFHRPRRELIDGLDSALKPLSSELRV